MNTEFSLLAAAIAFFREPAPTLDADSAPVENSFTSGGMMRPLAGILVLSFFLTPPAFATEKVFRIFSSKQITPRVDRFYGQDDNAFATMFCAPEVPQVMIVDSRLPDLDGKTFYFSDLSACKDLQQAARTLKPSSIVDLILTLESQSARGHIQSP